MRYNLLDRSVEKEIVPCCQKYGVGLIPWGPLAGGFLTGKYHRGEKPAEGRLSSGIPIYGEVLTGQNFDKLDRLEAFARERGHSVLELAVAWLLSHRWLGSVIAGVTTPEQLSANAAGSAWKLNAEEVAEVEKII
jgi:aryl-alcohol dehydrogenase-like predicted oxidoreductase